MKSIMKHSNERGSTPEKKLSISPILTYYSYYNDNNNDNNDKADLIKTKRYLRRSMPKLNSNNDGDFEYY